MTLEEQIQKCRESVEWAERNPYQCNIWFHRERLEELNRQSEEVRRT